MSGLCQKIADIWPITLREPSIAFCLLYTFFLSLILETDYYAIDTGKERHITIGGNLKDGHKILLFS